MSDGVFRCGPFSTLGVDAHVEEPATPSTFKLPVNGAYDSTASWPFKLYSEYGISPGISSDPSYDVVDPTGEIAYISGAEGEAFIDLAFAYQAAQPFNMSYELFGQYDIDSFVAVILEYQTFEGGVTTVLNEFQSGVEGGSLNESGTVTLPAATTPTEVRLYMDGTSLAPDLIAILSFSAA